MVIALGGFPLLRIEFDFYQFFRLVRGWLELPVAYGCHGTLGEDRMTALYIHGLDGAIGSDADFELDHAPEVHRLGEGGVSCRSLLDDLSASIGGFLSSGVSQSENESDSNEQGDMALPQRGLHIKKNLRNLGDNLKVTKVMALISRAIPPKILLRPFRGIRDWRLPISS